MTHLKVLEREGQADSVEAQLLQAPHNGGKILGQAVIPLAQIARRCQPSIEAIPAALSGLQDGQAGACRLGPVISVAFLCFFRTEAVKDLPQLAGHEESRTHQPMPCMTTSVPFWSTIMPSCVVSRGWAAPLPGAGAGAGAAAGPALAVAGAPRGWAFRAAELLSSRIPAQCAAKAHSHSSIGGLQKQSPSGLEFSLQGLIQLWQGGLTSSQQDASQWAFEAGNMLRGVHQHTADNGVACLPWCLTVPSKVQRAATLTRPLTAPGPREQEWYVWHTLDTIPESDVYERYGSTCGDEN